MLPEEKYSELLKELDECQNPLFIFDDDPDGLCSFLLFYRYKKIGDWCFVKSLPKVSGDFVRYINNENDKIFILDMPEIDDDFFDNVNKPIIWVDHHPHEHPQHVKSFNPHDHGYNEKDTSTTALCYKTVNQDLWLASIGAVADWTMPDYIEKFKEIYPDLLNKDIINAPDALFNSKLSKLIEIFSMILKGNTKISKQCIKKLMNIKSPYELLLNDSKDTKFINKKISGIMNEYNEILKDALNTKTEDGLLLYIYSEMYNSFSSEISNYLQYKNPNDLVIVGRLKNGEYKLSIRSQNHNLNEILNKILIGLDAHGGGHDNACGACVREEHFDEFILRIKNELKTQ